MNTFVLSGSGFRCFRVKCLWFSVMIVQFDFCDQNNSKLYVCLHSKCTILSIGVDDAFWQRAKGNHLTVLCQSLIFISVWIGLWKIVNYHSINVCICVYFLIYSSSLIESGQENSTIYLHVIWLRRQCIDFGGFLCARVMEIEAFFLTFLIIDSIRSHSSRKVSKPNPQLHAWWSWSDTTIAVHFFQALPTCRLV